MCVHNILRNRKINNNNKLQRQSRPSVIVIVNVIISAVCIVFIVDMSISFQLHYYGS